MARIPEEDIRRLKSDIPLQGLVESRGISLKRHGQHDLVGLCPFHDDKNPSLIITPSKNIYHCLGCGAAGSVIDWVMNTEGVSFRHAVELLQSNPVLAASQGKPIKQGTTHKLAETLIPHDDEQILLSQVIDYYHDCLKHSPEALDYLDKRGLKDNELINYFKLGYANRTLGYRLPKTNRKAGADVRGRLQELGILRKTGHEHFWGSVVVPVINDNQVCEVYGRKIRDDLKKGTAYHLYLPGGHQGVFNLDALRASTEIILCESVIDAMTFWINGYKNVTASYGTQGFTDDILAAFKQHRVTRVLIAYDRDEAGNKAATDLAAKLIHEGFECYRVLFPKGMDANEYALSVRPAKNSLGVCIRSATWMGKGKPPAKDALPPEPVEPKIETSPVTMPRAQITVETKGNDIFLQRGDRHYRVRGLQKNLSFEQMKINLMVSRSDDYYVDTLELYTARQRNNYIQQAAQALNVKDEVVRKDLGQVLLTLEALQEKNIQAELDDKDTVTLTEHEQQQAIEYLKHPDLLNNILDDFNRAGIVGEETNKLVGYLAAVSRLLDKPLAVMVQSSSAAGKSSLMDAVLAMIPDEDKSQYSAMTGQSLFYMGQTSLKNKILAIAEEEGASNASYALKLLQSEGEISIASTGKDESTGQLVTQEYRVEGPVMLYMTSTAIDIDEELLNRCLVLSVDESRQQTKAIHALQRQEETLDGLFASEAKNDLIALHQNAQRLLKPLAVANPYAQHLTFLDDQTRTRRDHKKYLTLIKSIALLHQYQRELKTETRQGKHKEYIEVSLSDIKIANQLAHEVLGRTLDELPPQTRKLLSHIQAFVIDTCKQQAIMQRDYRFSRKTIRDKTGWSDNQLKVHCKRLEDMEYLLVHRGGRGQSLEYELLYDGDTNSEQPQLMGLIDIEKLKKHHCDTQKLGQKVDPLASSCRQVVPMLVPGVGDENTHKAQQDKPNGHDVLNQSENTCIDDNKSQPSYVQDATASRRKKKSHGA